MTVPAKPWIDRLRLWTQDLYIACMADAGLPAAPVGTSNLRPTVRKYTLFQSNPAAPPSLRMHATRHSDSLVMRNRDYNQAKGRFSQRLARGLLLDLDVLQDESLLELVKNAKLHPTGGVESYVNQLGANLHGMEWVAYRSVELSAVRNCITHNGQVWHAGQVARLDALRSAVYSPPVVGTRIDIQLEHLFAYKTAVRTLLNRCSEAR